MPEPDMRNIRTGVEIPTESYSDQPYIVQTDDGAWLCVLTTGSGHEGQPGQHVVTLRSNDCGRTWSPPLALEPADGPEASYAVLLKAPSGRIFCFYNHNTDNIREIPADNPPFTNGVCRRVDSLGYFVFRYSDDHGRSWCPDRITVPIREMDIDRTNATGGKIRFFWNVGKPFVHDGAAYISVHKVGGFGAGFFTRSEGILVRSNDLLEAEDPATAAWITLPEGEFGLRTPDGGGPIAEEQSYAVLSDGSFYAVYRSVDGHPVEAYSRDEGRTWSQPRYKAYADGRLMKHPRAANFVWTCANGNYLYWFHNHGGRGYEDRNPVWLSGGRETHTEHGLEIEWSQPEIVLYDPDPYIRMSYPDLVEEDGTLYLSETQKDIARVHRVDPRIPTALWTQFDAAGVTREGLVLERTDVPPGTAADLPDLPAFCTRDATRADYGSRYLPNGFTIDCTVRFGSLNPGQILVDNRRPDGHGFALWLTPRETLQIVLNDGRTENTWECDRNVLCSGVDHHVAVVVDGGPRVICFVVDGRLCDGGQDRQFGWGRFSPHLRDVNGEAKLRIAPHLEGDGALRVLRIYNRALLVSEAIANGRLET